MGGYTVAPAAAAKRWQVEVVAIPRTPELQLHTLCPSCGSAVVIAVQAPPWHVPSDPAVADFGGQDGHLRRGFTEFEQARTAGKIRHEEIGQLDTELYCHRCQVRAPVTVKGT